MENNGDGEQQQPNKFVIKVPSFQEVLESSQPRTQPALFNPSQSFSQAFSFIKNSEFYVPPPPPAAAASSSSAASQTSDSRASSSSFSVPPAVTSPSTSSLAKKGPTRNAILVSHRQSLYLSSQTMSKVELLCLSRPSYLLNQLEHILESDPLIDEVGFIHPSQFMALSAEAGTPIIESVKTVPVLANDNVELKEPECDPFESVFWIRDHKLGISTQALIPLYNAAKHAFMPAYQMLKNEYEGKDCFGDNYLLNHSSPDSHLIESQVMKHSRALLMLSCDFGTAWNARKLVLWKKQELPILKDELLLSALILSYSPKTENAWSHRRWVIKMIAGKCSNMQEIVENESQLVKRLAEKSKMNYRAWYHRSWLVSYMSREQVLNELKEGRDWAGLHVSDNSCFHYRTRLMLRMLEDPCCENEPIQCPNYGAELCQVWKEELDWDEILLKRYIGREALWLHRRFLSFYWIKHFGKDVNAAGTFLDKEIQLFRASSIIPDCYFEDHCAQAIFSATYLLWLMKHMYESYGIELQKKMGPGEVDGLLKKVCPEKNFLLDIC